VAGFFLAQLVVSRWMTKLLRADAQVTAAMPANRIFPNIAPSATDAHLTHAFGGVPAGGVARPMGGSLSMVTLWWDVTAWNPAMSQQSLEPVMLAVARLLVEEGGEAQGRSHVFVDGSQSYDLWVDYEGPTPVPLEVAPADVWAPVRERFTVSVSPRE
jgi:hypothetical protein